jgi:S-formylglutathione hydrolase FrmB
VIIDIDLRKTQGTGDYHYKAGQLLPENFLNAARKAGYNDVQVRVREQVGYDHSYYFVSPHSEYSWSTCRLSVFVTGLDIHLRGRSRAM